MAASKYTRASGLALQGKFTIPIRETGAILSPVFSFSTMAITACADSEGQHPCRGAALLCSHLSTLGGTFMDSSRSPGAVQVLGWPSEIALNRLRRLLDCAYRVRWQPLHGFADRVVLLVELPHNPGLWRQVAWDAQVSELTTQRCNLPISPLSPSAGIAFPDAYALGQSSLPGVR